jgi:vinculin
VKSLKFKLLSFWFLGGKGNEEAAENRNYLAGRMTDEINEIIRVLQLTTYDEDEWDADQLTAMKRACNALESKLQTAIDWLEVILFVC